MWKLPTCRYLLPISEATNELRLTIWERIRPGPRIIIDITCKDKEAKEYIEAINFRITDPLAALLEQDFGTRILEGKRSEEYPPPIAL
jgi:hypothetical protein